MVLKTAAKASFLSAVPALSTTTVVNNTSNPKGNGKTQARLHIKCIAKYRVSPETLATSLSYELFICTLPGFVPLMMASNNSSQLSSSQDRNIRVTSFQR